MVINNCVVSELAEEEEFQRLYFQQALENGKKEDEDYEITLEDIDNLKEIGVDIDEVIIDEFDLDTIIDAKNMGLL